VRLALPQHLKEPTAASCYLPRTGAVLQLRSLYPEHKTVETFCRLPTTPSATSNLDRVRLSLRSLSQSLKGPPDASRYLPRAVAVLQLRSLYPGLEIAGTVCRPPTIPSVKHIYRRAQREAVT
jgi:hypothetical protein